VAILIIVEDGAREINDGRHKLRSEPVVQAHKQVRAGGIRSTKFADRYLWAGTAGG
jgi:hypothetical protein